jgi:branched-chain amino acid transport system permease protein
VLEALLVYGTVAGCIYTLLALGFALIYGVSGVVNMAHGAFFLIGAYVYSVLNNVLAALIPEFSHLVPYIAIAVTPFIVGVFGTIFYRVALHQVLGDEISILVVSIAGSLVVQQLILILFGSNPAPTPPLLTGNIKIPPFLPGGAATQIGNASALAAVASILFYVALWIFVSRTKIGKAMRASSQDHEAAALMGVNTERLYMLTAAIAAALAAVAGIFLTSSTAGFALVAMWLHPLAISFAIVVLGGLGSIKGTVVGAFIFGFAEVAVARLLPRGGVIVPVVPFMLLIVTLIIRPKGLFGKRVEMED